MAYLAFLAAADPREVAMLRAGGSSGLRLRAVIGVTHLIAYWPEEKRLRESLSHIVDGGTVLDERFWHPLRPPIVHHSEDVSAMEHHLRAAWEALPREAQLAHMFSSEIEEILALLTTAARSGSAIVSVLEPPADEERASKVQCPFDAAEKLPFPWNDLLERERPRPT